jgi:hypothetical protein
MEAPEVEHPQLPQDPLRGIAARSACRDRVSPPQALPHPLRDRLIPRPVRHQPRPRGDVRRPPPQHGGAFGSYRLPRCLTARAQNLSERPLIRCTAFLAGAAPEIPMAVCAIDHRAHGSPQDRARLTPPVLHRRVFCSFNVSPLCWNPCRVCARTAAAPADPPPRSPRYRSRAVPLPPASESMVIGRGLPGTPAAVPVIQAGRPARLHVRGRLRLHTGCGPSAR